MSKGTDFSGYYTIYGRKDISSPFKIVKKVLNPPFILKRSPSFLTEYRVSASTALGKESTLSAAYQDAFWLGYKAYTAGEYIRAITHLKEATLSFARQPKNWFLYDIGYIPKENQFDYYNLRAGFDNILDKLAHWAVLLAVIFAFLTPLYVIYLVFRR